MHWPTTKPKAKLAVCNCAKFEEIWYHTLQKTANVKIFTKLILCQLSPPEFLKKPMKTYILIKSVVLRYANGGVLGFANPVTLSKGQRSPKMMHTCSAHRRL